MRGVLVPWGVLVPCHEGCVSAMRGVLVPWGCVSAMGVC